MSASACRPTGLPQLRRLHRRRAVLQSGTAADGTALHACRSRDVHAAHACAQDGFLSDVQADASVVAFLERLVNSNAFYLFLTEEQKVLPPLRRQPRLDFRRARRWMWARSKARSMTTSHRAISTCSTSSSTTPSTSSSSWCARARPCQCVRGRAANTSAILSGDSPAPAHPRGRDAARGLGERHPAACRAYQQHRAHCRDAGSQRRGCAPLHCAGLRDRRG